MAPRIYPDVNTSSVSNQGSNRPIHRLGDDINAVDQLASPILLGIAFAGAIAAMLLVMLVIG